MLEPLLQPLVNLGLASPETKFDWTAPTLRRLAHGFVAHTAVHLVTGFPFPTLSMELATTVSPETTPGVWVSDARSPTLMVPRVGRSAHRPCQKIMATSAVELLSIELSPPQYKASPTINP